MGLYSIWYDWRSVWLKWSKDIVRSSWYIIEWVHWFISRLVTWFEMCETTFFIFQGQISLPSTSLKYRLNVLGILHIIRRDKKCCVDYIIWNHPTSLNPDNIEAVNIMIQSTKEKSPLKYYIIILSTFSIIVCKKCMLLFISKVLITYYSIALQ